MKIHIDDLKKAIKWIEENSRDILLRLELDPMTENLTLRCEDKYQVQVEIKIFNEHAMGPRIKKEDSL